MHEVDLKNIRNNLNYGDNKKIQKLTGLSLSYISEVLNGKKKSDNVLEAASQIAAENIARRKAISDMLPPQAEIE